MADEREHQEELLQNSPANQPEASISEGNAQITNLIRGKHWGLAASYALLFSGSKKHCSQPRGSNATPVHTRIHTNDERKVSTALAATTSTRHLTPDLPLPPEGPVLLGTMNVEERMRNIMSEEMRTLEAQMEQSFSSQIHRATTSTPRFDDLTREVRETPFTKWITNTITPKFGSISFPSVVQGPHESLRAYIKHFSKAISEIYGLNDGTTREALKKGLRDNYLFKNEICARYPPTIQDAMHRAKGLIELEEENERVERDLARMREEVAKARDEQEKTFRHKRTRPVRQTEHQEEWTSRRDHKRPFSPPKYTLGISPSELIAHLKRQDFVTWPKKLPDNPARDIMKYCEFHKDYDHDTVDCRAL
ncbi:hypothetical protein TIFTF001_029312 [Ficus carica]|uniref:Retrotransposon gag domain-containing protein n=1 Tax=Ficus carica TaxID=3494 RepID=A0AA88DS56_FICCA|nr:hypothetical protein TIFTF001_029312 [Ficus carica]